VVTFKIDFELFTLSAWFYGGADFELTCSDQSCAPTNWWSAAALGGLMTGGGAPRIFHRRRRRQRRQTG